MIRTVCIAAGLNQDESNLKGIFSSHFAKWENSLRGNRRPDSPVFEEL